MIKINLSVAQNQLDIANFGGIDLTKIKYKAVALAILFLYVPDFTLVPYFETERTQAQEQLTTKQNELSDIKRKVGDMNQLEKQIQDLKEQERILSEKLVVVKQILSEKKNPSGLLVYIARNIPDQVWISELSTRNDEMKIIGESLDYANIGKFLESVKNSVFVKEASVTKSESIVREPDKRRVEKFEINFKISVSSNNI